MNFLSRKDARLIGAVRYFTGKLCKNGHIDERFVSNGSCVTCEKERRERPDNIEKERIYRAVNSEKARKRSSEWYANNQEKVKKYREDNVDRIKNYKQSDKYKEYARKYERNNAEHIKQYRSSRKDIRNAANRLRYAHDPDFKCVIRCREMVWRLSRVYNIRKDNNTFKLLGYTGEDLRKHIESLFKDGMTWNNYGEWHIDHVIPIKVMIDNGVKDPKWINALWNLQPLWAKENLSKGARLSVPMCGATGQRRRGC